MEFTEIMIRASKDPTNRILVIDDEARFRKLAVDVLRPVLPQGWEVIAPDTLSEALSSVEERVKIALIDGTIDSEGYQPPFEIGQGIKCERFNGVHVANFLRLGRQNNVMRIAFPKEQADDLGSLADITFDDKVGLFDEIAEKGVDGKEGRICKEFRDIIFSAMSSLS
ncbi:hypothetical protein M0P48_02810 [Candidatus Gracilibacteria bacterium]|nr:hypothetical protein [Candidatus Gracilibacteria bacterium]